MKTKSSKKIVKNTSIILKTLFTTLFFLLYLFLSAQNTQTFTLGPVEAKPGEKVTGKLIIEDGKDKGTFIPVTIINGNKPGPVLTLNAGIHGTEYVPIITLQQLSAEINPLDLTGTLILVHIANIPSFHDRSAYVNPIDNKNLNRVFPGTKDGTLTERIAYTISNKIIKKSDYYIDLHGGEFNERIVDYLYFGYNCPDSDLCKKSRMLAHAMGNKYLIPYDYNTDTASSLPAYSEAEAFRQGVAAVTNEWGDAGTVHSEDVKIGVKGLINVMRTIGMLDGETFKNEHPVYLFNEQSVSSNYNGILYTFADKGQIVSKGTMLGYTTDYWGKILEKYFAPLTGIVAIIKTSPPITKGEEIFRIAEVSDKFEE